ncbi:hypothetical protein [Teichococcus vastitatis]|uniref:Uncharacterized protein n=1 Tax=Teichococcus vastitatis TaxID=2307076 RepID=A0ABS9W3I3_9PROT|nr:hypothetical protein [Pseudoroseomonas vastitatis]MCI0753490.1 hypothetical protein [Pseudoroseomonas vastitatis]
MVEPKAADACGLGDRTSTRLGYLAMRCGLFFGGHRAVQDCLATLEILARSRPRSGRATLAGLLEGARQADLSSR